MPPAPKGFYNPPGTRIFVPIPTTASPPHDDPQPPGNATNTPFRYTYPTTPSPPPGPLRTRVALVTVGATAPFRTLSLASLSPAFLNALATHSFTKLHVQAGDTFSSTEFQSLLTAAATSTGVEINAFDFHPDLGTALLPDVDLVVSHAGAGSVLEALRWGKRLVVVENKELMGGHQREIIEELGEEGGGQGYLVEGRVERLGDVVGDVMGRERKNWEHVGEGGLGKLWRRRWGS
jgi:beta-1,4-N-acetylglucosaminyltransferase